MIESNKPVIKKTNMAKMFLKIIGIILLFMSLISIWSEQYRSFYCLSKEKCITVWKRSDNRCYVIPGKYYGVLAPRGAYIKTTNRQYLTIYFSSYIPNKLIVRNQGNYNGEKKNYKIVNNISENWRIVEYSNYYKSIIYKNNAIKFKDVRESTDYLELDIKENYATDKTGQKIE